MGLGFGVQGGVPQLGCVTECLSVFWNLRKLRHFRCSHKQACLAASPCRSRTTSLKITSPSTMYVSVAGAAIISQAWDPAKSGAAPLAALWLFGRSVQGAGAEQLQVDRPVIPNQTKACKSHVRPRVARYRDGGRSMLESCVQESDASFAGFVKLHHPALAPLALPPLGTVFRVTVGAGKLEHQYSPTPRPRKSKTSMNPLICLLV